MQNKYTRSQKDFCSFQLIYVQVPENHIVEKRLLVSYGARINVTEEVEVRIIPLSC